jgi:hypothetical protein
LEDSFIYSIPCFVPKSSGDASRLSSENVEEKVPRHAGMLQRQEVAIEEEFSALQIAGSFNDS